MLIARQMNVARLQEQLSLLLDPRLPLGVKKERGVLMGDRGTLGPRAGGGASRPEQRVGCHVLSSVVAFALIAGAPFVGRSRVRVWPPRSF